MSFQRKGFVSLVVSQQLGKKNINFKIKSKRIKTRHLNKIPTTVDRCGAVDWICDTHVWS